MSPFKASFSLPLSLPLFFEKRATYKLEAIAEDRGSSPLSRTVEVQIDVVDRSNKPPVWDQTVYGPIYVKENTAVGESVTSVKARSVFPEQERSERSEKENGRQGLANGTIGNFLVVVQLIHRPPSTQIRCKTTKKCPFLFYLASHDDRAEFGLMRESSKLYGRVSSLNFTVKENEHLRHQSPNRGTY